MNYFVAADNGMIEVFNGVDNLIAKVKDAKALAYVFQCYNIEDVMCSSSVDFADEYGFENCDDAKNMINEAFKLI